MEKRALHCQPFVWVDQLLVYSQACGTKSGLLWLYLLCDVAQELGSSAAKHLPWGAGCRRYCSRAWKLGWLFHTLHLKLWVKIGKGQQFHLTCLLLEDTDGTVLIWSVDTASFQYRSSGKQANLAIQLLTSPAANLCCNELLLSLDHLHLLISS